eukprot:TRINITY_DN5495_c0_g1_i1.p1 TRINITY_DN5495_c0_g1~~TRINITY_DN5495_c0_g1_i1.p1  ORF type:complete len:221 (-),score=33.20 TRINITY_DN5495_c0_g1_i1:21-683(-)
MSKSLDFSKIKTQLALTSDTDTTPVVFVLSGALSPVHKMHVECFEIAKKKMEEKGYRVVGAYLCPSSDNYVQHKLGPDAFSLKDRVKMCELATKSSEWIDVNPWGWANAFNICRHTTTVLNEAKISPVPFRVFLVVGSDHAFRHTLFEYPKDVICIHRDQQGSALKKAVEGHKNEQFILIDGEPVDISSTLVRTLLQEKEWKKLEEILSPGVVDFLKAPE